MGITADLTAQWESRIMTLYRSGMPIEQIARETGSSMVDVARLVKALARALAAELVHERIRPLVQAQIESATGIAHFFLRDAEGKFTRITDADEIEHALNAGDPNGYYISTRDPSTAAFIALMDRAIDKPVEHQEITGKDGAPIEIEATLMAGRLAKLNA